MQKRSSKRRDVKEIAASIVHAVETGEMPRLADGRNPLAVALGRLGGLKGGKARAARLSSEQRSEIAKKAAHQRWANRAQ